MRLTFAAAVAAMFVLAASGSNCFAADNAGTGNVVAVDVVGKLVDQIALKNGDTISYAVFMPKENVKVNDKDGGNYVKDTEYDAFLLNQKDENGKIKTQTFIVWSSRNDAKLQKVNEAKIRVITAVGAEGSTRKETKVKTGQQVTIVWQEQGDGTRQVTIETFDAKVKDVSQADAEGGFSFSIPK